MIQSARCCGGGRLPFIRHSHLMGYSTHFLLGWEFCVACKKNENGEYMFFVICAIPFLYLIETERY